MRELPALFSTPMVQAILENRKTMTRRTKGLETINIFPDNFKQPAERHTVMSKDIVFLFSPIINIMQLPPIEVKPKYQKGDKIWIREEHKVWHQNNYWFCEYNDGSIVKKYYKELSLITLQRLVKRKTLGKWQRGRFLPKDFCRIWLECTGVRCERLQDISQQDAVLEGILPVNMTVISELYSGELYFDYTKSAIKKFANTGLDPIKSFMTLWVSINNIESWTSNPWVFVYEFKRIEK